MTIVAKAGKLAIVGAVLFAAGCTAGSGATGEAGPQGPVVEAFGAGGRETDCTPGALFCDGDEVWLCHRSGLGGRFMRDCASGTSATNPSRCTADNRCPVTDAVCCLPEKSTCSWNVIAPVSVQGTQSPYLPAETSCYAYPWPPATIPPDACGLTTAPRAYSAYLSFSHRVAQCPDAYVTISLSFDRAVVAPSSTPMALPRAGVGLSLSDATGAASCRAWTGTLTWVSDAPSWRVIVNAVCSDGSGRTVSGEFWGDA